MPTQLSENLQLQPEQPTSCPINLPPPNHNPKEKNQEPRFPPVSPFTDPFPYIFHPVPYTTTPATKKQHIRTKPRFWMSRSLCKERINNHTFLNHSSELIWRLS
ncbi:hypothetical protein B0T21DRAFT_368393 [Apiosordaria backusii]|uniref:Uncharacterized protein n=1 Tax=Apiosordaria backusii TaxID=314023 RepID=A0AA40EBT9_9PEZI|nr:hypothetical protein B0T21DRAFT_368393 [Apiosordaria backusii]